MNPMEILTAGFRIGQATAAVDEEDLCFDPNAPHVGGSDYPDTILLKSHKVAMLSVPPTDETEERRERLAEEGWSSFYLEPRGVVDARVRSDVVRAESQDRLRDTLRSMGSVRLLPEEGGEMWWARYARFSSDHKANKKGDVVPVYEIDYDKGMYRVSPMRAFAGERGWVPGGVLAPWEPRHGEMVGLHPGPIPPETNLIVTRVIGGMAKISAPDARDTIHDGMIVDKRALTPGDLWDAIRAAAKAQQP